MAALDVHEKSINLEETLVMENDENQPPLSPRIPTADKLNCNGTLLKESHWNNIELTPAMIKLGSSKQSPASSTVNIRATPTEEESTDSNTNLQCLIEDEKCKVSVTPPLSNEDNVKFASEVISELVDSLPLQIDQCLKIDISTNAVKDPSLNSPGEKHDNYSICSNDYNTSDSSFDTAREDLQQSLPETEYESANDFDESSIAFASSPRDGSSIPASVFLKNLQTVISNRNKVPPQLDCSIPEWNDDSVEDCLVPFDRESTPLVSNELLYSSGSPVEFVAVDNNDNICGTISAENIICGNSNENFETGTQLHLSCSEVTVVPTILNESDKCSEEEVHEISPIASSENISVRNRLNSDNCSDVSVDTVVETGIVSRADHRELDLQTENDPEKYTEVENNCPETNSEIKVDAEEFTPVSIKVDSEEFTPSVSIKVDAEEFTPPVSINADEGIEVINDPDLDVAETIGINVTPELINAEETKTDNQYQEPELIQPEEEKTDNRDQIESIQSEQEHEFENSVEQTEYNILEKLSENLDNDYWPSECNNCQFESDKLIVTREDSVDGVVNQEETKEVEVDIEERLKLEASLIAEELINSSLRGNDFYLETRIEEGNKENKSMKDNKMADTENNETTREAPPVDGKMDENVNPFQSKSKLGNSPPVRRSSAKMKNGEVSTPTKLNTSHESPLKKSTSAPKPTSSTRITPIASPKRKGSGTTPTHNEVTTVTKDQVDNHGGDVDVDNDGFKKPTAKQPVSARSSSSKVVQNEIEAGDVGMMVRSVEDNLISEAGPDVAEYSDAEFRNAAEAFKDPAAFDFLQMAGSKHLSGSALARMSLYVKFDPLLKAISPVARRSLSKTSTSDQSQMSDGSDDLLLLGTPTSTNKENSDKPQETNGTPMNKNACVEGRLLDLSPSPLKHHLQHNDCSSPQSGCRVYSEEEFIQALRMQELLFQEQLLKKDLEANEKTKVFDKELRDGSNRLTTLQKNCDEMKKTVLEYEKTISQLIDDREREKQLTEENINSLRKERDQSLEDLQGVEKAFGDLHRRFEKSKAAVEGFKKNEEILTSCVKEGQVALKKQEQKYELLKRHAEETLTCANQEIDALRRTSEVEIAALRAQLKKAEMKAESLEKTLQQMHKENSELTNICDELIAKVGQSNA